MGAQPIAVLSSDGVLHFLSPVSSKDLLKPVPFIPRPIDMDNAEQWKPWLIRDQRFVTDRPDVVSWQSTPLTEAVHIMGAPAVDLFAATSGTDSDWVVKLIDVYPNDIPEGAGQGGKPAMAGYELPIGIEIFRGRYLNSFAQPAPLKPGKKEWPSSRCRFAPTASSVPAGS